MLAPAIDVSEAVMRRILDRREVYIVYQPLVDLRLQKIFAYEALARSKAPEIAGPLELFAAATRHDCVGELGRLLRELTLDGCPELPLFVNIHPSELNEKYLVQTDDPIFQHTNDIFLEITESVPLSHFRLCQSMLDEVRDRGVHLVVDDLGAGYSNLKYIADLHPRVVKIDRGLIMGLTVGSRVFKLVSSIVRMCSDLDALVVAEGIETIDEFEACVAAGAHFGQGYLLARPAFPLPTAVWPSRDGLTTRRIEPTSRRSSPVLPGRASTSG
ncbi:MAG: EAL domain-containing protein [Kofleriaceae bacterium]